MKPSEIEHLLWQLSAAESTAETELPPDELLIAYRAGKLPPEAETELERQLAQSPTARARLLELSDLELEAPSPDVRQAVLSTLPPSRPSPGRRGIWLAAALAATLSLAVGFQLMVPRTQDLPADLDFDVKVEALADVRSPNATVELVTAYPQTRVRLTLEARSLAIADLEFGLYRLLDDRRLERLQPGPDLTLEVFRGNAVFSARAGDLVGDRPGAHQLLVVVSRRGQLPEETHSSSASDLEALLHDPMLRAYRLELILLQSPGI